MKKISVAILAIFLVFPVWASDIIAPFSATYISHWEDTISITAQATQTLTKQQDNYEFKFTVNHALLKLNERSEFLWIKSTLQAKQYQYSRSAMGITRDRDISFDWQHKKATGITDGTPWEISVSDSIFDKLNYQLQLRADLKLGKSILQYPVVDNGKIKTYVFQIAGKQIIKTPLGSIETLQVERVRSPKDDRKTTFWLATKWDYLLVKFRQTEKGKTYEINLENATIDGKNILNTVESNP